MRQHFIDNKRQHSTHNHMLAIVCSQSNNILTLWLPHTHNISHKKVVFFGNIISPIVACPIQKESFHGWGVKQHVRMNPLHSANNEMSFAQNAWNSEMDCCWFFQLVFSYATVFSLKQSWQNTSILSSRSSGQFFELHTKCENHLKNRHKTNMILLMDL